MAAENEQRTISEDERLQAIGLLVVAKGLHVQLDQIQRTLAGLLGQDAEPGGGNYYGHVSDAIWSEISETDPVEMAHRLIVNLGIEVVGGKGAASDG